MLVLAWGLFPVAVKVGTGTIPPFLLAGVRFALASAVLMGVTAAARQRLRLTRHELRQMALLALAVIVAPSACFFWAIRYAPAGVLATLWGTSPLFTALFMLRSTDRVNEARGWRAWLGLLAGFAGAVVILQGSAGTVGSGPLTPVAEGVMLLGTAIFGWSLRGAKRSAGVVPLLSMTAWQLGIGGVGLLALSALFERGMAVQLTAQNLGILAYLTLGCGCLTFGLTFWLIRRIGAVRTAFTAFLEPGITLVLAAFLLGEPITLAKVAGLVLVVTGLVCVSLA
ncbi:MAG: EamA family transporter [Ktedonobacterales bacterium]